MLNKFRDYVYLVLGSLSSALALDMFLAPNKIAPGGASGLGTILYNAAKIPVSLTVFAVNIILFAVGFKRLGKKIVAKTFLATALMSGFIQIFSFLEPFTHDLLLAAVLGSALLGLGSGLTIISGASTGGTDILGRIIQIRFSTVPIGKLLLIVDSLIIAISLIIFRNVELVLFGIISLFT